MSNTHVPGGRLSTTRTYSSHRLSNAAARNSWADHRTRDQTGEPPTVASGSSHMVQQSLYASGKYLNRNRTCRAVRSYTQSFRRLAEYLSGSSWTEVWGSLKQNCVYSWT